MQHQQQNRVCFTKMKEKFGEDAGYLTARETLECMTTKKVNTFFQMHIVFKI